MNKIEEIVEGKTHAIIQRDEKPHNEVR